MKRERSFSALSSISFGRARFDAFLRAYFDEHVFQSITTADFVSVPARSVIEPGPAYPAVDRP